MKLLVFSCIYYWSRTLNYWKNKIAKILKNLEFYSKKLECDNVTTFDAYTIFDVMFVALHVKFTHFCDFMLNQ